MVRRPAAARGATRYGSATSSGSTDSNKLKCLAELHCAALEIAENSEELLSCPLLKLLTHLFGWCTAQVVCRVRASRAPRSQGAARPALPRVETRSGPANCRRIAPGI